MAEVTEGPTANIRGCSVPDCDNNHHGRGLCSKHYQRVRQREKDPSEHPLRGRHYLSDVDTQSATATCAACKAIVRIKVRPNGRLECMNRVALQRDREWEALVRAKYGITRSQYEAMAEEQRGRCGICGSLPEEGEKLSVDHCHDSGRIRGLLCRGCNFAIAHLKDSAANAVAAAIYLLER